MTTSRVFKYAVNKHGRDKDWNWETLATQYQDREGTIQDVISDVASGYALLGGLLGGQRRSKANVIGSEWLLLDIDNSDTLKDENGKPVLGDDGKAIKVYSHQLTLDEAIAHPFVQQYCSLIYTTASHEEDWHRFRLVFLLPEYVESTEAVEAMVRLLMEHFPHDPSCKDASRVFYGSTQATFPHVNPNNCLPADWLNRAIALAKEEKARRQAQLAELAAKREQFQQVTEEEGWNTDELIRQALSKTPPRSPGSGNYDECRQVLMALVDYYGPVEGAAIAEQWSPSIPGNTWNIAQKVRSFRRDGITIGTLFKIAQGHGFKFPERKKTEWKDPQEPDPVEYQARLEKQEQQKQAEKLEAIWRQREKATGGLKGLLRRQSKPLPAPKPFTTHKPDEAFEYEPGGRLAVWRSLTTRHKFVLDQSGTGSGKSFDSGNAKPEDFEVDRLLYFTDQTRNPTNETLSDENAWKAVEARHGGLKIDDSGKLRVAKPGDVIDVPANCSRTSAIAALRAKNVFGADTDAACLTCPTLRACKQFSGPGYGAKRAKRIGLQHDKIRIHPASAPEPTNLDYSNSVAIFEEAGQNYITEKQVGVKVADIDQLTTKLALESPELFSQVQPVLARLKELLAGESPRYGFKLSGIREAIPTIPDVDLAGLAGALEPDLSALEAPDEIQTPDIDQEVEQLKAELKRDQSELDQQKAVELASIVLTKDQKAEIRKRYSQRKAALKVAFDDRVRKFKAEQQKLIKRADRLLRKHTAQGSTEIQEKIEQTVVKQWLPEFLGVLKDGIGTAHIHYGKLTLTLPDTRLTNILKAHKAVIFLDATLSREDLALKLGCDPSEIVVVRQEQKEADNQEIIQIVDLGRMGMQRGADQKRRLSALVADCKKVDPDAKVIDFKRFEDEADGLWWRDSRGVNDFLETKTLILVGTPCQNLNSLLAEYACLTGGDDMESEDFKAFVDRKIRADIQQAIGRLRANRRPDEQLHVFLITDFDLEMPNVRRVKASFITPAAAGKFERFQTAATSAMRRLREAGEKVTQTAVSALCGYSQQYVSRYWKLLQTLLETTNSKSGKKSQPSPDVEDLAEIEVAASVLEEVTATLPPSRLRESIEDLFFETIPVRYWRTLLSKVSDRAKSSLLESLIGLLPSDVVTELEAIA